MLELPLLALRNLVSPHLSLLVLDLALLPARRLVVTGPDAFRDLLPQLPALERVLVLKRAHALRHDEQRRQVQERRRVLCRRRSRACTPPPHARPPGPLEERDRTRQWDVLDLRPLEVRRLAFAVRVDDALDGEFRGAEPGLLMYARQRHKIGYDSGDFIESHIPLPCTR